MGIHIIIANNGQRYGKTRSEHEENMRKEGYRTMDDATLDKLKFLEKRYKGAFIHEKWAKEVESDGKS